MSFELNIKERSVRDDAIWGTAEPNDLCGFTRSHCFWGVPSNWVNIVRTCCNLLTYITSSAQFLLKVIQLIIYSLEM